jgi:hypothetical protein
MSLGRPDLADRAILLTQRIEQALAQHQDQSQADWDDHLQSFLGLFKVFEFSRPDEAITCRIGGVPLDILP